MTAEFYIIQSVKQLSLKHPGMPLSYLRAKYTGDNVVIIPEREFEANDVFLSDWMLIWDGFNERFPGELLCYCGDKSTLNDGDVIYQINNQPRNHFPEGEI